MAESSQQQQNWRSLNGLATKEAPRTATGSPGGPGAHAVTQLKHKGSAGKPMRTGIPCALFRRHGVWACAYCFKFFCTLFSLKSCKMGKGQAKRHRDKRAANANISNLHKAQVLPAAKTLCQHELSAYLHTAADTNTACYAAEREGAGVCPPARCSQGH